MFFGIRNLLLLLTRFRHETFTIQQFWLILCLYTNRNASNTFCMHSKPPLLSSENVPWILSLVELDTQNIQVRTCWSLILNTFTFSQQQSRDLLRVVMFLIKSLIYSMNQVSNESDRNSKLLVCKIRCIRNSQFFVACNSTCVLSLMTMHSSQDVAHLKCPHQISLSLSRAVSYDTKYVLLFRNVDVCTDTRTSSISYRYGSKHNTALLLSSWSSGWNASGLNVVSQTPQHQRSPWLYSRVLYVHPIQNFVESTQILTESFASNKFWVAIQMHHDLLTCKFHLSLLSEETKKMWRDYIDVVSKNTNTVHVETRSYWSEQFPFFVILIW